MHFQSGGKLSRDAGERSEEARDSYAYNPAVGEMSGILVRGNVAPWAMPLAQRLDETHSLTYTAPPLESPRSSASFLCLHRRTTRA
jgi:predicted acyl esterase